MLLKAPKPCDVELKVTTTVHPTEKVETVRDLDHPGVIEVKIIIVARGVYRKKDLTEMMTSGGDLMTNRCL